MLSKLLWQKYLGRPHFERTFGQIRHHQLAIPSEARSIMARLLHNQIRYFGNRPDALPEWKEAARIAKPEDLYRVWPNLPVVTREHLRTRFPAAEIGQRFALDGAVSRTGGSTGEPTSFFHDSAMLDATTATRNFCRLAAGWRPGMQTLAIWGSERDVGKSRSMRNRVSSWLRNEELVGGYALSQATIDPILSSLRRHKQVAIYGFTSMLDFVCRHLEQSGIAIPAGKVAAAWNGGEMLFPEQAERFERVFHAPLLNLYGSRELSAMAYQPSKAAALLPLRPLLYLEIVNAQGNPASPGETGRLLWTSTVCRGTPFLRYECGDVGTFLAGDEDESGIRAIHRLEGRSAGLIEVNGRTLNGLFWNHLFKDYPEVQQFQVVIRGTDQLTLRLKGEPLPEGRQEHLDRVLSDILGPVRVEKAWVDQIPLTRQGKLEQVVRE